MRSGFRAGWLVAVFALVAIAIPTQVVAGNEERDEFYRSLHQGRGGAFSAGEGPTALLVSGVMGPGSYDEFRAAVMRTTPELVVLDGPGGILGEALLIGEEIRRRKLNTMVGPNRSCASACAIAFLSGRVKYLGAGASIGLHSASFADGRADPEATEIMAAYLRGIGVPNATLRRMARTAPNDIRWLTRAEQRAMGIKAVVDAP
jgi:membrane-bound ClpP family serine protease